MKPTFKQFLEDISVEDDAYSYYDAEETVRTHERSVLQNRDGKWKPLPAKFPEPGFKLLWKKQGGTFDVVLLDTRRISKKDLPFGFTHLASDDPRVAVHLSLDTRIVELPTGKLNGVTTNVLSGNKIYRGSGIASMMYETLVRNGQVLFSSDTQTSGGKSNWIKLTNRLAGEADIGLIFKQYGASEHVDRYSKLNAKLIDTLRADRSDDPWVQKARPDQLVLDTEFEQWLGVGDLKQVQTTAYKDIYTTFVIAPKGTFAKHMKYAIQV